MGIEWLELGTVDLCRRLMDEVSIRHPGGGIYIFLFMNSTVLFSDQRHGAEQWFELQACDRTSFSLSGALGMVLHGCTFQSGVGTCPQELGGVVFVLFVLLFSRRSLKSLVSKVFGLGVGAPPSRQVGVRVELIFNEGGP